MKQIATVRVDGSISGLERKGGFDLKKMGLANVKRASEVLWNAEKQLWYVEFRPPCIRPYLNDELWMEVIHNLNYDPSLPEAISYSRTPELLFNTYEDAVKAEIATLDYLRLKGEIV